MCRMLVVFALAFLASVVVGQIHYWSYKEFPDPNSYDTYSQCRRYNLSNVCDPDEILSREEADEIDSLIHSIYRETRCGCQHCADYSHGYQMRVAIMPRMKPIFRLDNSTSVDELMRDAQMFAYLLSDRWTLGGWCNESVLILYSRYDGVLYTLTLKGAREKLTDQDVKKITLAVRPYFDDPNTVGDGLKEMIMRYKHVLNDNPSKGLRPGVAEPQSGGAEMVRSFITSAVLTVLMIFLVH